MDSRYFSEKVAEWYGENKRQLPWREQKDPYKIWISEVILQQTRVNQGLPYYKKFVETFPTVFSLASAPETRVLRLWQGLGYYSRARNLHKCAKQIVSQYQGKFPTTFEELKKLPGIGDYTAAAIASIAFAKPVAVVDGNVYRVLARIFGIDVATNTPLGKKIFFDLANRLIPAKNPDVFNQAVMEFGALFCTPQNPSCEECVFRTSCFARKKNLQDALPVKNRIKKIKKRYFYYFVFRKGKSFLMKKREEKDIWHGLYDFHLVEKTRLVDPNKVLEAEGLAKKNIVTVTDAYKHVLSHQVIYSRFIVLEINRNHHDKALRIYSPKKISGLPKPVLITRFLKDYELLL